MDGGMVDAVLGAKLEPVEAVLKRRGLVELNANRPSEIWLEFTDGRRTTEKAPALTADYWRKLCHILANNGGVVFDPETQPFVSTRLPGGHRFEAMVSGFCETGLSVSIRMFRHAGVGLSDFGITGEWAEKIISAVSAGNTIFVSGGTSSGKTTLLNVLVEHIPVGKRVLTVEDTRELRVPHRDRNHFVPPRHRSAEAPAAVDYAKIIDHLMRSRPDIVIAGELSIRNTFPSLRLLNTGHKGFMCTVHANSARLALEEAIEFNCNLAGYRIVEIARYMRRTVDLVVQVMRVAHGRRQVVEIWEPASGGEPTKLFDGVLDHD
jgi:Flp pilus assembly CpaF family ATPase